VRENCAMEMFLDFLLAVGALLIGLFLCSGLPLPSRMTYGKGQRILQIENPREV
jgi:hypothetical protein